MLPAEKIQPKIGRRILVVDDNIDHVHSLVLLLRDMGHTVDYAINGIVALDVAKRYRPEVVLLDLGLPDGHGSNVARELRRDPQLREVRIVALTGRTDPADHQLAVAAGCDAVLMKPVGPGVLEQAVTK